MTPRPCCLTSSFLPLAWPDCGHSRPPSGPWFQPLHVGVKWDQGGGTSVRCSFCGAQDSRQAAQNVGGKDESCGNETRGRGWRLEGAHQKRQRAGVWICQFGGGKTPEILGRQRNKASWFTCLEPEALGGTRCWEPVAMGEGKPWNCKGVRSLGGGGVDARWGPWAKGRGVECLPISSVAPFQGPRFSVLL